MALLPPVSHWQLLVVGGVGDVITLQLHLLPVVGLAGVVTVTGVRE